MPQDFSGQNLRGRSFKAQNLEGANFSGADIRGVDFSGVNLRSANFSHATAGLAWGGLIALLVTALLFAAVAGLFLPYFTIETISLFTTNKDLTRGFVVIILGFLFTYFFLRQGLFVATVAIALSATFSGMISLSTSIVAILVLTVALTIAFAVGKQAVNLTLASSIIATLYITVVSGKTQPESLFVIVIVTIAEIALSVFISRQALAQEQKYAFIRTFAILFGISDGTRFQGSDLTDANFTAATLESINLLKANITRTCWFNVKKLNIARFDNTYLEQPPVLKLVTSKQGQSQNFDYQNLRGVNLQGANLTDASFIGADLSHTNLQDADLTRAKLVQTQLDGTDFTGATLTGAYIEDWNITTSTKFDGVCCEYVYMRLPTPDNPDPHRKPDNRQEVFADGEFGDFIKPIFDTLDLYHSQGVDPRAIAISFKQLAENHPEADLRIVGMEVRGEDKFLLRAKTAIAADKSELSAKYFTMYNQLKALAEQEVQKLIAEKDNRITDLQNMVVTALQRPSFYAQTYQNQGDTIMPEGSKQVFNNNLQNAQFGGGLVNADTVNAGQIGGNITNYNPEQRQNLAQAAADIQQLLNQLSQTYPTTTTSERMTVVAKAVDEIESNPTLKARVIGALKAGGTEAFKELIDHPLVNILLASIEGWQDAE
ncbi:pentapeptide repeat-containing protein [Nostoc sp. FACHB-87]|uniref:pentapeptide repeat-containing protein n=1 Tax=Nostocaceae TaxID=1162 RepID=UPI00168A17B0|nr:MULTISPECIES: pentapeptide repeat-containing protein [Nostocaceae]MBD2459077.1 pentapeptide repeat-containing protein [Nostoc sp. FACHB-87]MBD2480105.1 pentapeptide repeat-containing protein [Anabaena sp. FACHB-83]